MNKKLISFASALILMNVVCFAYADTSSTTTTTNGTNGTKTTEPMTLTKPDTKTPMTLTTPDTKKTEETKKTDDTKLEKMHLSGEHKVLATTTKAGSFIVVKVNVVTGQAWYKSGSEWVDTVDPATLPKSHYDFKIVTYPDSGWGLARIDVKNGDVWVLDGESWKKIEHPKK